MARAVDGAPGAASVWGRGGDPGWHASEEMEMGVDEGRMREERSDGHHENVINNACGETEAEHYPVNRRIKTMVA